jgi:hypothetical protein
MFAERIRARLAGGVYVQGSRKGQPLDDVYRISLERQAAQHDQERLEYDTKRAALEAEPDPLVALGIYTRRRPAPTDAAPA